MKGHKHNCTTHFVFFQYDSLQCHDDAIRGWHHHTVKKNIIKIKALVQPLPFRDSCAL